MSENYFLLPKETQLAILNGAATKLNIKANIIEKDIWICWVLQKLFTFPLAMAFKGGTSLSKVYNLINRFSEDVDVTIDYRELSPDINLLENLSKSVLKKIRSQLEEKLKDCTTNKILPFLFACIKSDFPDQIIDLALSDDGEKLRVHYPSLFDSTEDTSQCSY